MTSVDIFIKHVIASTMAAYNKGEEYWKAGLEKDPNNHMFKSFLQGYVPDFSNENLKIYKGWGYDSTD